MLKELGDGFLKMAKLPVTEESYRSRSMRFVPHRILPGSETVNSSKEADEKSERRQRLQAQEYDFEKVVSRAEPTGMNVDEVRKPGKPPQRVKARCLVRYWAVLEIGLDGTSVMLGESRSAFTRRLKEEGNRPADRDYSLY